MHSIDLSIYRFPPHLKLELKQYIVTSIGLIIRRRIFKRLLTKMLLARIDQRKNEVLYL
mgnify:CR=1 FL=1|jgi:hypothetical protein